MKRLALAASLLVAAGCTPPDTDVAVSGELPERVVVRAQSFDLGGVWATPATAPGATTTTTVPPTTTAPPTTVAPRAMTAPAPPPVGECSGWGDLVAAYFPGEEATACRVMACESRGNPSAVSATDDHGLWQLNRPSWEHRFAEVTGVSWSAGVYDPVLNTRFAAWLRNAAGWTQWACY